MIRLILPIFTMILGAYPLLAPTHPNVCVIDARPSLERIERTIARIEGFPVAGSLPRRNHNPGALHNRRGASARFKSDAEGWRELHAWWLRHDGMSRRAALLIYNSRPEYGDRILAESAK